jgi:O-antigen ligase
MLGFLAISLVSIWLWNPGPVRSAANLYDRVFVPFSAYWLIRLTVPGRKDLERLLWVALITIAVQTSVSVVSRFAPLALPPVYQFSAWSQGRTVGTLRSSEVYSSTLAFSALLLYHHALTHRTRWRRIVFVSCFAVAVLSIFLSFSRSSWLGILVVVVGLLLIYPKTTSRLVLALVLLVVLFGGSIMGDELSWAYERLTGDLAQRSTGGRIIIDNAMLGMMKDRPFFGWGYNRYRYYIAQFKVPVGETSVVGHWHLTSHNTFLTIGTELGVPALLIYLFPVGWWLLRSLQARQWLPTEGFWSTRLVIVLWLAMLHMFIEHNFVDMISHNPFGTTLWWMALGLIATVVSPHLGGEPTLTVKPSGLETA